MEKAVMTALMKAMRRRNKKVNVKFHTHVCRLRIEPRGT